MLHQIMSFAIKHWMLVSGFLVVTVLLFIEEAKSQGPRSGQLSPALATHLINREDAIVIDLRDAAIYREGHIVNAKNMAFDEFERHQQKLNNKNTYILVDATGTKTNSLLLRLKKAGFEKIFALRGGMDAWKAANMPVTKK